MSTHHLHPNAYLDAEGHDWVDDVSCRGSSRKTLEALTSEAGAEVRASARYQPPGASLTVAVLSRRSR